MIMRLSYDDSSDMKNIVVININCILSEEINSSYNTKVLSFVSLFDVWSHFRNSFVTEFL